MTERKPARPTTERCLPRFIAGLVGLAMMAVVAGGCDRGGKTGDAAKTAADSTRAQAGKSAKQGDEPIDYTPPGIQTLKDDELGRSIRRGLALVMNTHDSLPAYAPGNINCTSCHLNGGLKPGAAAMFGVAARYPKYTDRTGAVVMLEDRVNYCFTRSMAGRRIPASSTEMRDIVAYLTFISRGVPMGSHVKGEGMPAMPTLSGDTARGRAVFTRTCMVCHGAQGQGMPPGIPALWGAGSYAVSASMAREGRAATFIRHFMPYDKPGTLTDQQAYDVSAYINAMPRPDSPGKENDWPTGGAPADVPYATRGHAAYRPPARLIARDTAGATVPAPTPAPASRRRGG